MSHPIIRRRFSRAFALTLTTLCAVLLAPAAALADGQLDATFNGTGAHVGTAAEGTIFSNAENRIPMIVQADGKIVAGGARGGLMTLVRYNVNGSIDTTFGSDGFATRGFGGTPSQTGGNSGAVAMTQDGDAATSSSPDTAARSRWSIARFTAAGVYNASAVCYAPHLIDYTARALALRPNGSIVLVGYARDRHASAAVPRPAGVLYGLRAIVTLPASGNSTTACGTYTSNGGALARLRAASRSTASTTTAAAPTRRSAAATTTPPSRSRTTASCWRPRTARTAPPGCSATSPPARPTPASPAPASCCPRAPCTRSRCSATARCWQPARRSTRPSPPTATCRSRASPRPARWPRTALAGSPARASPAATTPARRSSCRATAA